MSKVPLIHLFTLMAFCVGLPGIPLAKGEAINLPAPGTMVALSPAFTPSHLKGIVVHPESPLQFDFIIHKGDVILTEAQKKEAYTKLVKYFLASLAIPDEHQWVNLSPYEKDRIIQDDFGKIIMGRDLLAQDYILKQLTASLIYPEKDLGKKFWDKIYTEAQKKFGTTNIPVNTFNKVWIMPDDALIYEKANTAYVLKNHLKVMLEEDYIASLKNSGEGPAPSVSRGSSLPAVQREPSSGPPASNIIRAIILPAIEKEVNEGKNFAPLRQVYNSMLLATWFKRTLKQSLLAKIYVDKAKIKGLEYQRMPTRGHDSVRTTRSVSPSTLPNELGLNAKATQGNNINDVELIYQQYLQSYKKGVFNLIKEDSISPLNGQGKGGASIPRKYFSGGVKNDYGHAMQIIRNITSAQQYQFISIAEKLDHATVVTNPVMASSIAGLPRDAAEEILSSPEKHYSGYERHMQDPDPQWTISWFSSHPEIKKRVIREIFKVTQGDRHKRILSLGEGQGHLTRFLSKLGYSEIFGVDIIPAFLKEAQKKTKGKVGLLRANAESLPFDDHSFDMVIINEAIGSMRLDPVFKEVHRVLRAKGKLIITHSLISPDEIQDFMSRQSGYLHYSTHELFEALTRAGFSGLKQDHIQDFPNTDQFKHNTSYVESLFIIECEKAAAVEQDSAQEIGDSAQLTSQQEIERIIEGNIEDVRFETLDRLGQLIDAGHYDHEYLDKQILIYLFLGLRGRDVEYLNEYLPALKNLGRVTEEEIGIQKRHFYKYVALMDKIANRHGIDFVIAIATHELNGKGTVYIPATTGKLNYLRQRANSSGVSEEELDAIVIYLIKSFNEIYDFFTLANYSEIIFKTLKDIGIKDRTPRHIRKEIYEFLKNNIWRNDVNYPQINRIANEIRAAFPGIGDSAQTSVEKLWKELNFPKGVTPTVELLASYLYRITYDEMWTFSEDDAMPKALNMLAAFFRHIKDDPDFWHRKYIETGKYTRWEIQTFPQGLTNEQWVLNEIFSMPFNKENRIRRNLIVREAWNHSRVLGLTVLAGTAEHILNAAAVWGEEITEARRIFSTSYNHTMKDGLYLLDQVEIAERVLKSQGSSLKSWFEEIIKESQRGNQEAINLRRVFTYILFTLILLDPSYVRAYFTSTIIENSMKEGTLLETTDFHQFVDPDHSWFNAVIQEHYGHSQGMLDNEGDSRNRFVHNIRGLMSNPASSAVRRFLNNRLALAVRDKDYLNQYNNALADLDTFTDLIDVEDVAHLNMGDMVKIDFNDHRPAVYAYVTDEFQRYNRRILHSFDKVTTYYVQGQGAFGDDLLRIYPNQIKTMKRIVFKDGGMERLTELTGDFADLVVKAFQDSTVDGTLTGKDAAMIGRRKLLMGSAAMAGYGFVKQTVAQDLPIFISPEISGGLHWMKDWQKEKKFMDDYPKRKSVNSAGDIVVGSKVQFRVISGGFDSELDEILTKWRNNRNDLNSLPEHHVVGEVIGIWESTALGYEGWYLAIRVPMEGSTKGDLLFWELIKPKIISQSPKNSNRDAAMTAGEIGVEELYKRFSSQDVAFLKRNGISSYQTVVNVLIDMSYDATYDPAETMDKLIPNEGMSMLGRQLLLGIIKRLVDFIKSPESNNFISATAKAFTEKTKSSVADLHQIRQQDYPKNPLPQSLYLDLASGLEYFGILPVAKENDGSYLAVDNFHFVSEALNYMAFLWGVSNFRAVHEDVNQLKRPDGLIGVIRMKNTWEYVQGFEKKLNELIQWLSPGGILVFQNDSHNERQKLEAYHLLTEITPKLIDQGWGFKFVAAQYPHFDTITLQKPKEGEHLDASQWQGYKKDMENLRGAAAYVGQNKKNKDLAMNAPGGIDMNSSHVNLRIKRDENGQSLTFNGVDMAQFSNLEGLEPVVLSIKPASQTPIFTELLK